MSRQFLTAVVALLTAGFLFMTWIDYRMRAVNDQAIAACVKPTVVPSLEKQAVFFFAAKERHEHP